MRMWLFGLISLFEMQMLRAIRTVHETDDWWFGSLSDERLAGCRRIFEERKKRNEEISLSDCLQVGDKATIIKKRDELFALTGLASRNAWKSLMTNVESLRNDLAHGNDLGTGSWPMIASVTGKVESILEHLERFEKPETGIEMADLK